MPNQVEMFIDQQTLTAMHTGRVPWLEPTAWRANGLDNSLFPSGIIPFKGIRLNNTGDPVHDVAAKYYALAHRRNHVEGPPVALLQLSLPQGLGNLFNDDVAFKPHTSTYGLRSTPPAHRLTIHNLQDPMRQQTLEAGYRIIEAESIRK